MDGSRLLGRIGAISVTVSFAVATEIERAATEDGMRRDELIVLTLVVYVLLLTLPSIVSRLHDLIARSRDWVATFSRLAPSDAPPRHDEKLDIKLLNMLREVDSESGTRSLLSFANQLMHIAEQITLSLTVQLITLYVSSESTSRSVRIITLLTVSVFFMFFQWSSAVLDS